MSNDTLPTKKSPVSNDAGDDSDEPTSPTTNLKASIDWGRSRNFSMSSPGSAQEFDWRNLSMDLPIEWSGPTILEHKEKLADLLPRVQSGVEKVLNHAETKQFALGRNFVIDAYKDLAKQKEESTVAMASATRSGISPDDADFGRVHHLEAELDRYISEAVRLHNLAKRYNDEIDKWRTRVQEIEATRSDLLENYKTSRRQNQLFEAVARPNLESSPQSRISKSWSPKKTPRQPPVVEPRAPDAPHITPGSPRPPPQPPTPRHFVNARRMKDNYSLRPAMPNTVVLVPLLYNRASQDGTIWQQQANTVAASSTSTAAATSSLALSTRVETKAQQRLGGLIEDGLLDKDQMLKNFAPRRSLVTRTSSDATTSLGTGIAQSSVHSPMDILTSPPISPKPPLKKKLAFAPSIEVENEKETHHSSVSVKEDEAIALTQDGQISLDFEIDCHEPMRGRTRDRKRKDPNTLTPKDDVCDEAESGLSWLDRRLNSLKSSGKLVSCNLHLQDNKSEEAMHSSAEQQETQYLSEISVLEEKLRSARADTEHLRTQRAKVVIEKSCLEEFFLLCMADLRRHMQQRQNLQSNCRIAPTDPRLADGHDEVLRKLLNSDDVITLLYEQMFPHRAAFFNIQQKSCGHNRHRILLPFLQQVVQEPQHALASNEREVDAYLGL